MHGELIEFELSSTDVTTAAALTLRESGATVSRTLGADERLVIHDITIAAATATVLITVIRDTDEDGDIDAGDRMFAVLPGNTSIDTKIGAAGAKGVVPKVIASVAGQVSVTGRGVIVQS